MDNLIYGTTKVYKKRTTIPKQVRELLQISDNDEIVWYNKNGVPTIKKNKLEKKRFDYG